MPFTNSPLADAELDAMLGGAATRLGTVADGLSLGPPPAPSSAAGPRLAAVAAVGLATAGVAAVLAVSNSSRPAVLPPGFTNGAHGTEVKLEEVDDGDGNPDTIVLQASAGGRVQIRRNGAAGVTPTTAVTSVPGGVAAEPTPDPEVCIDSTAGGACGTQAQIAEPMIHPGQRGADGAVMVTGVPDDVVVVAFAAGAERHWERPLDGVVLFPFEETASPDVVVTLVRGDGSEAARLTASDATMTDAEVAAKAVTASTGLTLPAVWLADITAEFSGRTGVWLRGEGRPTATGFGGPFAAQGFTESGSGLFHEVEVITARTDQVALIEQRLAVATSGRVRRTIENPDGTTVLVWANDAVVDGSIDTLVATLAPRQPTRDQTVDLTQPWAWFGQRSGANPFTDVPAVLFSLPFGTIDVDGRTARLWATADDLGGIRFQSQGFFDGGRVVSSDTIDPASPILGIPVGRAYGGLVPVPSSTTAIRLTMEDGTVVTPPLLDVRPLVDAKLAVVPTNGTVRSVETS